MADPKSYLARQVNPNGFSLIEALIALVILSVIVAGITFTITRLNALHKHSEWRQAVSELHNALRRYANCSNTIAGATCDGSTPVTVVGNNGQTVIGAPPNNTFGKLSVNVTCQNSALSVSASVPSVLDPLTRQPLSFVVAPPSEGLCATPAATQALFQQDQLLADLGPDGPTGPVLYGEYYGVTTMCPPGYQVIGDAPNCQFPSSVNPDCCGGGTVSTYPVISGTQSGWYVLCTVIWDATNGDIVQNNSAVCYRVGRSGRLDNE